MIAGGNTKLLGHFCCRMRPPLACGRAAGAVVGGMRRAGSKCTIGYETLMFKAWGGFVAQLPSLPDFQLGI
jgi:hypothetical protein